MNWLSKQNMGAILLVGLTALLSQSRMYHFLLDETLGKLVLLLVVVCVAYLNRPLGFVAVVFVVLAHTVNQRQEVYGYNYHEGFEANGTVKNNLKARAQSKEASATATTTSSSATTTPTTTTSTTSTNSSSESFKGREGFCMTDRESTMLRGKQSNAVPVYSKSREQSDDIAPTDNSAFSSAYASV